MSTAKELFKELGYEKAEKSESVVLYTNGYGDTISFKETKHVDMTPIQGCRSLTMTCLLENAIHKQCKELGWLEEEKQATKQETNFEHYFEDLLKVNESYGFKDGKIRHCYSMDCDGCFFNQGICNEERLKWLASPYEKPTYKLSRFEFDLLDIYKKYGMQKCIANYGTLLELNDKGHFKEVDLKVPIGEVLENCEIKGE